MGSFLGTNIQTSHCGDEEDGTVLIFVKDGEVVEVVSDLHLNVKITDVESEGYRSSPSRPLWEFLMKTTKKVLVKENQNG